MSDKDLQARFERVLRRTLSGATEGSAQPCVHVDVSPAAVTFAPEIKATLPALDAPLEVVDVQRFGGAFEYEVKVERTSEGLIKNARLVPVVFHPFIAEGT